MKFSLTSSWVVAALFATSSFAAVPLSSINTADTGRYVPNEYIVEMASISGLAGKRAFTGRTVSVASSRDDSPLTTGTAGA